MGANGGRRAGLAAGAGLTGLAGGAWWLWSLIAEEPDRRPGALSVATPPDARSVTMYLAGCVLFSLGVKLFIDAGLGVDPLHAMVLGAVGVVDQPFVGVGLVVSAVTAAFLALWTYWNRRLPPLATFLTMALVGFLVDLWNIAGLERWTAQALSPTPMMLAGLLLDAYASALIIMSGIGIRVMDLVAIAAMRRYGVSFLAAKMGLEASFLVAALALGGPVGAATVGFLLVVAPFIPSFMWANNRFLRLPNHGLADGGPAASPPPLPGGAA